MGPKKAPKVQSRWEPLPEGASTMQAMVIPELDDHHFAPEEMSKEELLKCAKYVEQSNRTLDVENAVIERYLMRMDPNALAQMNKILEAAAAALQKAERAAQLGGVTSSMSVAREGYGSRQTDDSTSTPSQGGTSKSSSAGPKLGIFGYSDRAPRVQAAQKIEIVNREIDELKTILENFRKKARKFNYILRCRNQEMTERLQALVEAHNQFEQKLLIEGVDPITGKLPGEKFIRYLGMRLKGEEIEIDRMRIKTAALKTHLKKVEQQLAQKEELGEILHAVDFEQLQIENRDCQEQLEEKVAHVIEVKQINGRYGTLLNVHKKKLQEQMNRLQHLKQTAVVKEKMIKQLAVDEEKVASEVATAAARVAKITHLMKSFTVPGFDEYINKKVELHEIKKEIKVCERQMKLRDLALAYQTHKIKSMQDELLYKSKSYMNATSPKAKESRIFFF